MNSSWVGHAFQRNTTFNPSSEKVQLQKARAREINSPPANPCGGNGLVPFGLHHAIRALAQEGRVALVVAMYNVAAGSVDIVHITGAITSTSAFNNDEVAESQV